MSQIRVNAMLLLQRILVSQLRHPPLLLCLVSQMLSCEPREFRLPLPHIVPMGALTTPKPCGLVQNAILRKLRQVA